MDRSFKAECAEVGRLIQPKNTPSWMTDYFVYWSTPLASEWSVALRQPTRAQMKATLVGLAEAADALDKAFSDLITRTFIESTHGFAIDEKFPRLSELLVSLRNCAYSASKAPAVSTKDGNTKRGRGKAPVLGIHNPKVFCAIIIAEAWKFLHGGYPTKNKPAAEAAIAYWSMSGAMDPDPEDATGKKKPTGWGMNRIGSWRPYFEEARKPEFTARRAECLRILHAVKNS